MFNPLYAIILELENKLANREDYNLDALYFQEPTLDTSDLERELKKARRLWAQSEETLVYSDEEV